MNKGCLLPIIFTIIGSIIGGVGGAFLGFVLGSVISQISFQKTTHRVRPMDNSVLEAITKLSLVLMKADASLMRSELFLFRDFMVQNFGSENAATAIEMLQQFKDTPFTAQAAAGNINTKLNYTERIQVLQFLFQLAGADGPINANELSVLTQIAQCLSIQQNDFANIRMMYEAIYNRQHYYNGEYHSNQQSGAGVRNSFPIEADYATLGVKSSDSNETIKAAYRRLAVANHPDKVQHLGEVARAKAEKRFSEINQAYSRIKKARNL